MLMADSVADFLRMMELSLNRIPTVEARVPENNFGNAFFQATENMKSSHGPKRSIIST